MRCDDGAESEEQGEAGTKLDHVDSNVGNECEDAGDSDEGERTTQGNDAVAGDWIIYLPGWGGDQWRMTDTMMS